MIDRDQLRRWIEAHDLNYCDPPCTHVGAMAVRLVVEGRDVWWCTTHQQQGVMTMEYQVEADECWQVVWTNELGADYDLCRIEKRTLILDALLEGQPK